jgi:SAM-dependent MidA family methyltransferase
MTPLGAEIAQRIAMDGPISVFRYMTLCLTHPRHGYYVTRDPFGVDGDFITAPEITQMFGELIGLWIATVWKGMGQPSGCQLVELGPGRGTLMADAIRATRVVPGFREAVTVRFVEASPVLRRMQADRMGVVGIEPTWHDDLDSIPDGPTLAIANEFFDALPIYQAVRTTTGWHERVVGLDDRGRFVFGLDPDPIPRLQSFLPDVLIQAPVGSLYEWRSDHLAMDLSRRIARQGGAALVLDYGHAESSAGETLQALKGHVYVDPLEAPGTADLTAHVDFEALSVAARATGATVFGPLEQGTFLRRLGLDMRAQTLKSGATPAQAAAIDQAHGRLTDMSMTGMGRLFKALAITDSSVQSLPAFDS